jgi:glucose-1-phosphate adenylyltransferase
MGNYVFTTRALCEAVTADAQNPDSKHDMGGNIIPMLVERGEANVYDFRDNDVPGSTERDRGYWRDVGTLDSFYDAHKRPALHPMISPGVVVSGSLVERSVVSPNVRVNSWAHVEGSVLMEGVQVGRRAVVRNAIIDKNVLIPEDAKIGVDLDQDRKRYTVSDSGIVVIGKGQRIEL